MERLSYQFCGFTENLECFATDTIYAIAYFDMTISFLYGPILEEKKHITHFSANFQREEVVIRKSVCILKQATAAPFPRFVRWQSVAVQ